MNWYKIAQRSLQELLQSLDSNPGVDRRTLAWLKTLESKEKGSAINMLTKHPTATIEDIKSTFPKVVPLTDEQETLVRTYPLIGTWMREIMERPSVQKRVKAFNTLRDKAARIRDWIDRTGKTIQGRTLENAVSETEKWHSESISLEKGEYLPTKQEDIVFSYPNRYTWQRISSGTDVKIEGQKMNHCVGSYCDDVEQGKIDVYSLRDENNSPLVTAGFKHNGAVVVQMKGIRDADPSQTYKSYIGDILKKLGTLYNDGEDYLDNNFNLKNFADLDADDIEKSTLLQKMINNQIAREGYPPDFAQHWVKKVLDSGEAPKEWEAKISASIMANGSFGSIPDWARDWVKRILESGRAPKEWEAVINSDIERYGTVPAFAEDWAKNKLESGTAPEEWEAGITRFIGRYGEPPDWVKDWAKKKLYSGEAPKEWEAGISRVIVEKGTPHDWAKDWANNMLYSGTAPKEWEAGITRVIVENRFPPDFAKDWAKKKLEAGAAPKELGAVITRFIERYGYPPDWALKWAEKKLDSGTPPEDWEAAITSYIVTYGRPPNWVYYWAKKKLDSGEAPKEWEEGITSYIERLRTVPDWAQDWAKNKNKNYKR